MDVRAVETLPAAQRIEQILVMAPVELIASKVVAYQQRQGKPKAGTDWRDLAMLLLAFPELKSEFGPVRNSLQTMTPDRAALVLWQDIVAQTIQPADEDEDF